MGNCNIEPVNKISRSGGRINGMLRPKSSPLCHVILYSMASHPLTLQSINLRVRCVRAIPIVSAV